MSQTISGETRSGRTAALAAFCCVLTCVVSLEPAPGRAAERLSVSSAGGSADGRSSGAVLSADGRFAAFASEASDLVVGDLNGNRDVFVRDRVAGTTERVSVSSSGTEGNRASDEPAISPDGRFVAFSSAASNLVSGDGNGRRDVFVHDRVQHTTVRASLTDAGGEPDVDCTAPSISADGTRVAFQSWGSNLVPGAVPAAWLRDLTAARTLPLAGRPGLPSGFLSLPVLSADGRVVVAPSYDGHLHRIEVDVPTSQVVGDWAWSGTRADVSPDGRFVAFVRNDSSVQAGVRGQNVFRYDHLTGASVLATAEHRWLGCASATNCALAETVSSPRVSDDGRFVGFASNGGLFDPAAAGGGDQVYVREVATGLVRVVSVNSAGQVAGSCAAELDLSGDGALASFRSNDSATLDPADDNHRIDVFAAPVSFSCAGDADCNDGNPCREAGYCDPDTQRCVRAPRPDGTVCPTLPPITCPGHPAPVSTCLAGECAWNAPSDDDRDGICNASDNCASIHNPGQADVDHDGMGDACDPGFRPCVPFSPSDVDGDGRCTGEDDCPYRVNPGQEDADADGVGDVCDTQDGVAAVDRMRIRFRRGADVKGRILVDGALRLAGRSVPADFTHGIFAQLGAAGSQLRFFTEFAAGDCRTTARGDIHCSRGSAPHHRLDLHRLTPLPDESQRWRFRMRLEPAFTTLEGQDFPGGPPSEAQPAAVEIHTGGSLITGLDWSGSFAGCRMSRRGLSCRP